MGGNNLVLTTEQAIEKAKREAKLQQKRDHYHANKKSILASQKQYREEIRQGLRVVQHKDGTVNNIRELNKVATRKTAAENKVDDKVKKEIAAKKQRGYSEKWKKKKANEIRERVLAEHKRKYPNG